MIKDELQSYLESFDKMVQLYYSENQKNPPNHEQVKDLQLRIDECWKLCKDDLKHDRNMSEVYKNFNRQVRDAHMQADQLNKESQFSTSLNTNTDKNSDFASTNSVENQIQNQNTKLKDAVLEMNDARRYFLCLIIQIRC